MTPASKGVRNQPVSKFTCDRSGRCCRNLRVGRNPNSFSGGEGIFEYFEEPSRVVFPVNDWEIGTYREEIRRRKKPLPEIVPFYGIRFGNTVAVLCWNVRQTSCPLVGNSGLCTIYEKRPTICRKYPVNFVLKFGWPVNFLSFLQVQNSCCWKGETGIFLFGPGERELDRKGRALFGECYSSAERAFKKTQIVLNFLKLAHVHAKRKIAFSRRRSQEKTQFLGLGEFLEREGIISRKDFLAELSRVPE